MSKSRLVFAAFLLGGFAVDHAAHSVGRMWPVEADQQQQLDRSWTILTEVFKYGNPGERQVAVQALERIKAERARSLLVLATEDRFPNVRAAAIRALVIQPGKPEVSLIAHKLKDPDRWVQTGAIEALGDIGDVSSASLLEAPIIEGDPLLRDVAFVALRKLGKKADVVLSKLLRNGDVAVRVFAAGALGDIGDAAFVPQLRAAQGDPKSEVRSAACIALAALGDKSVSECLGRILNGTDLEMKGEASAYLYALGHPGYLENLLREGDEKTRYVVVVSLKKLKDRSAIVPIYNALGDTAPSVRKAAIDRISGLASPQDRGRLQAAIRDDDEYVRFIAAKTLVRLGDKQALTVMLNSLSSSNVVLRQLAATELGDLGDFGVLPSLHRALEDADTYVKVNAVHAALKLHDKTTLPILERLFHDQNHDIIASASDAIIGLAGSSALATFERALSDTNNYTRLFAASGIIRLLG